jgi:hypothetical protein
MPPCDALAHRDTGDTRVNAFEFSQLRTVDHDEPRLAELHAIANIVGR